MTYRRNKKGFWLWKRYEYKLLDDFAKFTMTSKAELEPKECDIILEKVMKLNVARGEIKTHKGIINYKYNPKTWTDDNTRTNKKIQRTRRAKQKS